MCAILCADLDFILSAVGSLDEFSRGARKYDLQSKHITTLHGGHIEGVEWRQEAIAVTQTWTRVVGEEVVKSVQIQDTFLKDIWVLMKK